MESFATEMLVTNCLSNWISWMAFMKLRIAVADNRSALGKDTEALGGWYLGFHEFPSRSSNVGAFSRSMKMIWMLYCEGLWLDVNKPVVLLTIQIGAGYRVELRGVFWSDVLGTEYVQYRPVSQTVLRYGARRLKLKQRGSSFSFAKMTSR